jgi:regulator of sirC expression with transglutaminase-like and TPR domain
MTRERLVIIHLGIPITLAMVVVEVAERLAVDATVVGMPGHVLVGDGRGPTRWLDPFEGEGWLDLEGAAAVFARVHGGRGRFDRSLLAPTPSRLVLLRVIENLIVAARRRGDLWVMARAAELRTAVPGFGEGPAARVALAEAHAAVGRWADAIVSLEQAAAQLPPERREPLEARIAALRASAN